MKKQKMKISGLIMGLSAAVVSVAVVGTLMMGSTVSQAAIEPLDITNPEHPCGTAFLVNIVDDLEFTATATGGNPGDSLSWEWFGPEGSINAITGDFSWSPTLPTTTIPYEECVDSSNAGNYEPLGYIRVSDESGDQTSQGIRVYVNGSPDFNGTPLPPFPVELTVGDNYTFDFDATDPNPGDTLTYSLVQPGPLHDYPDGISINSVSGELSWTPTGAGNNFVAKVRATDSNGLSEEVDAYFVVEAAVNEPPVITNIPALSSEPPMLRNFTLTQNEAWSYDFDAVDPEGETDLVWSIDGESHPTSINNFSVDPDTGVVSWTPDGVTVGPFSDSIILVVTDPGGASDLEVIEFVVEAGCTDADGDGYSTEGGQCGAIDCDDNDDTNYPGQNVGVCAMCDSAGSGELVIDPGYSCADTVCEGDSCGGGSCGANIFADFPASVTNYCVAIGQCSQAECVADCEEDSDQDGYSASCGDCDDTDDEVNEGMVDGPNAFCDGKNNDCAGEPDEGCTCINGQTQNCGPSTDVGICEFGSQKCDINGNWDECAGSVYPSTEVCNDSLDNDCNATVDNSCSMVDLGTALAMLQGLDTSNDKTRKELDKAIEALDKALNDPKIDWYDNTHLACKHGNNSFDEMKEAVKKLMKLSDPKHKNEYDPSIEAVVDQVIEMIVKASRLLATTMINEATALNSKDAKELEKANMELGKGDDAIALGDFDKAVDYFKKAWQHAKKAAYMDTGCDYCDLDWDDVEPVCGS